MSQEKQYIKVASLNIDELLDDEVFLPFSEFQNNIVKFKVDLIEHNPQYELEFVVRVGWYGPERTTSLECRRLETDIEFNNRIKVGKILAENNKVQKIIRDILSLSKEHRQEVLDSI